MIACAPARLASAATGSIAAVSRPMSASLTPSAAKASVIAAPMPLAGPVIMATRPLSIRSMVASEQLLRQVVGWWQEGAGEDLVDRRRAGQRIGIDQDVDRALEPLRIDIAEADLGDLGMVHLVLERL